MNSSHAIVQPISASRKFTELIDEYMSIDSGERTSEFDAHRCTPSRCVHRYQTKTVVSAAESARVISRRDSDAARVRRPARS